MICASCGCEGQNELCNHHVISGAHDQWAETNRIMCAWIHRGRIPKRLSQRDRDMGETPIVVEDYVG